MKKRLIKFAQMGLFERIFSINLNKIVFYCFLKVVGVKPILFKTLYINQYTIIGSLSFTLITKL